MVLSGSIFFCMSVAVSAHEYGMPLETTDITKISCAWHTFSCSDTCSFPSEKSMVVCRCFGGRRMPLVSLCFATTSRCLFDAAWRFTAAAPRCAHEIVTLHNVHRASVSRNPCLPHNPILSLLQSTSWSTEVQNFVHRPENKPVKNNYIVSIRINIDYQISEAQNNNSAKLTKQSSPWYHSCYTSFSLLGNQYH